MEGNSATSRMDGYPQNADVEAALRGVAGELTEDVRLYGCAFVQIVRTRPVGAIRLDPLSVIVRQKSLEAVGEAVTDEQA